LTLTVGLDGVAISPDGKLVYLASMVRVHNTLHRISTDILFKLQLSDDVVSDVVDAVASKPQSDGLALTPAGSVILTAIEDGGLAVLPAGEGTVNTLTRDAGVIWADSVEVSNNGTAIFTDSVIPNYMAQFIRNQPVPVKDRLSGGGPYFLHNSSCSLGFRGASRC
jgi:DNA-binding beta-propeller fold protein YncE